MEIIKLITKKTPDELSKIDNAILASNRIHTRKERQEAHKKELKIQRTLSSMFIGDSRAGVSKATSTPTY